MRNLEKKGAIEEAARRANVKIDVRQLDIEKADSVISCFQDYIKSVGRIDVLVNNAGAGKP